MAFFVQSLNAQLYIAPSATDDRGFAAFLLPTPPVNAKDGYDIDEALTSAVLNGSFFLSAYTPVLDTTDQTNAFVGKLLGLLGTGRYIIWLNDVDDFSVSQNTSTLYIASDGSSVIQGIVFPMITGISLQLQNGMLLTAADNGILLGATDPSGPKIQFTGPEAPDQNKSNAVQGFLQFSGTNRGSISFSLFIDRGTLSSGFNWGFQMLIPLEDNPNQTAMAEYLPFADGENPSSNDLIGFDIVVDPTDVFNLAFDHTGQKGVNIQIQYDSRRTVFDFTGSNQDLTETILNAYYFTTWGQNIQLVPAKAGGNGLAARLVLNSGEQYSANAQESHLAPEGDFMVLVTGATAGNTYPLQCGLQGTEFFNLLSRTSTGPGDSLRFIANQPAYAPVYPLPQSSPLTAPVDPNTPLLDTTYRSSWCTIYNGSNAPSSYLAQPRGAALYGSKMGADASVVGHSKPNFTFNPDESTLFPMLPYAAVVPNAVNPASFSEDQIQDFEKLFVSSIRKKNIEAILIASHDAARTRLRANKGLSAAANNTVTTPSGLIAELSGTEDNPVWQGIDLARNQDAGGNYTKMFFENPDSALVQAFQTSDQFLVIANNDHLGAAVNADVSSTDESKFYNEMFIGDWTMQANTGTQNKYNDYNNIIIVKGRKGVLYDPDDASNCLVANWQKWTNKETFAAPTTLDANGNLTPADQSQLVILSQWLQTYFSDAYAQTDDAYFGNFKAIATDPNWTGILILGMNISKLPANLYGILSGVRYPDDFRAHHFGINITPIKQSDNGPNVSTPNSMFGLIYYNDPDFINQDPPEPIAPDLSQTYDFVLLNLKVLFENTSVKSFQSYAQLTTNNYFGSSVDHMGIGGNSYNTMVFKGSLQFKGSEAIYSLSASTINTFYFDSPIVNKIEVTNANFSTVGTDAGGNLSSIFAINGYWDFRKLSGEVTQDGKPAVVDFDLLSFGSDTNSDEARKGLIFNNLIITMVSPPYVPGQTTALTKTMTFDTSKMTFDQARSTPRINSIYINFALNLQNLVQGTKEVSPTSKDYLTVITDIKVSPVDGTPWVGLSYQLNMGTPGALAGNVGLTSSLLIAWDPTAKVTMSSDGTVAAPPVLAGIKLPGTGGGAKLISLQSVLKLSIGQIRLSYVEDQSSFLLMLTEIAIKFMGLLKIPPNGSSLFYLFGNPKSDGKASGLGWYAMYKKDSASQKKLNLPQT